MRRRVLTSKSLKSIFFFSKQFQNIRCIRSPILLLFVFVNTREILMFFGEYFDFLLRIEVPRYIRAVFC